MCWERGCSARQIQAVLRQFREIYGQTLFLVMGMRPSCPGEGVGVRCACQLPERGCRGVWMELVALGGLIRECVGSGWVIPIFGWGTPVHGGV